MKPRDYQKDASKIAEEKERCVFVLPTGTGKTFIGLLWLDSLFKKGKIKRAIVLEPTRILVEQVYRFYKALGMEVQKIYGVIPKEKRGEMWKRAKIVITTPETAYSDLEFSRDFEAVVVDECHHSVGDDFYAKFLKESEAKYRLGLSAFVPRKRKREIEEYIGEIIEWGYEDERIRKYIPNYLIDIFESPFLDNEMRLYKEFEENSREDLKNRIIWRLAMKFFSRDGNLALRDSLRRKTRLAMLLKKYEEEIFKMRELHKLRTLFEILETFEFKKVIVFVDRVVVAKKLKEIFKDAVLILGRRKREEVEKSLEEAREKNFIIATSAGEEGLDLPAADLLVNWSNVVSPLRLVQRYGRVLRKTTNLKFITHIITPETIDVDSFLKCIIFARKYLNIEEPLFKYILRRSKRREIIEVLRKPLTIDLIAKYFMISEAEVRNLLKIFLENGEILYFFAGEKYFIRRDSLENAYKEFGSYFEPNIEELKISNGFRSFKANFEKAFEKLKKKLPIRGLKFVWRRKVDEIEEVLYKKYDFLVKDEEALKFVLRNAFCERSWL